MRFRAALATLVLLGACTPGGSAPPPGGGAATQTIDVNLTLHAPTRTPQGEGGGYAPPVTTVAVGSTIRFVNSDGFAHTATLVPGATTFPAPYPFKASDLNQSGSVISQPFSSGALVAGASSQIITIDAAGTYIFGCFFHYLSPMRGVIIAQ